MHHIWRDYQKIVKDARYEIDPRIRLIAERGSFLGKDHYYYIKGNELKSLVNIPEGMSGFMRPEHWELCNPQTLFPTLESADAFIRKEWNDNEMELIDLSDKCMTQEEIRSMFKMKVKVENEIHHTTEE